MPSLNPQSIDLSSLRQLWSGAPCKLERITARYPRWVTGPMDEIERLARDRGRMLLFDARGQPMILFEDAFGLRWALERETLVAFHEVAP